MGGISEEAIRVRAYQIWEREGRPQGRDFDHWLQAQVELVAEVLRSEKAKRPAPPAPRPKSNGGKSPPPKPSRSSSGGAQRAKRPA